MRAKPTLAVRGTRAATGESLIFRNSNRASREIRQRRPPRATNASMMTAERPESRSRHKNSGSIKGALMQDRVRSGVLEDRFTGAIESQTSKVPSSGYLAAAFGAITASAILKIVGKDDWALFVGQWPAAFLLMGVYNKIVKQHGSDAYSKAA